MKIHLEILLQIKSNNWMLKQFILSNLDPGNVLNYFHTYSFSNFFTREKMHVHKIQDDVSYKMCFGHYPSCHQWREGRKICQIFFHPLGSGFSSKLLTQPEIQKIYFTRRMQTLAKECFQLLWMLFSASLEKKHVANDFFNLTNIT